MNQAERRAYLLSQGDDTAHFGDDGGVDNAEIRAAMNHGPAKKGAGISGIDPISIGLSAISSIFGHHSAPRAPDEPRHWMTVIATGVPYETGVSGGIRTWYWNGQSFISDSTTDGAAKMKAAMTAAGATPAKPLGLSPSPSATIPPATVASQSAMSFGSLGSPLVLGALLIGGFFVVRSMRRRR